MSDLLAQNANYVMALLDRALGCTLTMAPSADSPEPCTCDLTGRHFMHHCPTCDITWIKA